MRISNLLPLVLAGAAAAQQAADFNLTAADAAKYGCEGKCRDAVSAVLPEDLGDVGKDFDFDFYATASNFSKSLAPGEILVAPSTDPGWTPLFLTAGGLVMEMGGANSHGAVVAREYGIPAVVGVPDATGRISTGQEITVDGGAGTIIPA